MPSVSAKRGNSNYLSLYNGVSALGWIAVLAFTLLGVDTILMLRLVQSAAAMEILHSLLGWVRSPLLANVIQVGSRLWIAWLFVRRSDPLYLALVMAWGLADICRYLYYLYPQSTWLSWWRYTLFIGLYPVGVTCEMLLMARMIGTWPWLKLLLGVWPLGFLFMYGHMWRQRFRLLSKQR